MSKKEKFIKQIYQFFDIAGSVFTFYILATGVLALYAFSEKKELLEMLDLTITYQFYVELFSIYIVCKGVKIILFNCELLAASGFVFYSMIACMYLAWTAADVFGILSGFLVCFTAKMLIVVLVKAKKYSYECIGYKVTTVTENTQGFDADALEKDIK